MQKKMLRDVEDGVHKYCQALQGPTAQYQPSSPCKFFGGYLIIGCELDTAAGRVVAGRSLSLSLGKGCLPNDVSAYLSSLREDLLL